jgi:DNA-binding NarL/FixJ family response regulator
MTTTTDVAPARAETAPSPVLDDARPGRRRTSTIRLLVVDGRPLVRWALSHIAADAEDVHVVGEIPTAAEAGDLIYSLKPDAVTIDCSLPEGQGWQLARYLRDRYEDLGIVLLIAEGSDDLLFRALDSGASAYLSKDAPVHEVLSAIRHAASAASSFTAAGLAQALRRRHQTTAALALSPRESQVLALLREGRSVPEVAATLYVSLSTAKTYVARLYDKLGASNRAQALMAAVRLNLFDDYATMVS